MTIFTVTITDTGDTYRCSDKETVLEGMARIGKKGIPVGCRGGGCGVCKIEVTSGLFRKKVMSREHVSEEDEMANRVLACRIFPESDISVRVIGLMKKSVCKAAPAA